MRSVSAELAAAIEAPERVVHHRVAVAWDGGDVPGPAGSLDDLTPHVATARVTQSIAANLPEQTRLVAGAAAAQLDLDLGRGNVIRRPVAVAHGSIATNTSGGTASTSVSVSRPSGAAEGETLLWCIAVGAGSTEFVLSTANADWAVLGWRGDNDTGLDSRVEAILLTRRVGPLADEPSTYTLELAGSPRSWATAVERVSGAGALGVHAWSTRGRDGDIDEDVSRVEGLPVTTTVDDCLLVSFFAGLSTGNSWQVDDATDTERADVRSTSGTDDATLAVVTSALVDAGEHTMAAVRTVATPLNANPYFDSGITSWTIGAGAQAHSTAVKHSGAGSLRITPDGTTATISSRSEKVTGIVAGNTYTASFWAYTDTAWSNISPAVDWYTSGDVFISTSLSVQTIEAGVWTHYAITYTAPPTAAKAELRCRLGGTAPAVPFYFDEATLAAGTVTAVDPANVVFTVALAPMIAGDDSQHAAWTFSEINANSPYAGKLRFGRRCLWEVGFATPNGPEYVPVFTGLTLAAGATSRSRRAALTAIDNRETMREPVDYLPPVAAETPINIVSTSPLYPGLEATWIISYLMFYAREVSGTAPTHPEQVGPKFGAGYFAAPNPRRSCLLYVPCHGSLTDFVGGGVNYAYTKPPLLSERRVKFRPGPYVAATEPGPTGGSVRGSWQTLGWEDGELWNGDGQTAGRFELCARMSYGDSGEYVLVEVAGPDRATSTRYARLTLTGASTMTLDLKSGATTRNVVGPSLPTDGEWHWYGVHWDSVAGSATFSIDGTDTTVAFATWATVAAADYAQVEAYAYAQHGGQFAELHVDAGLSVATSGATEAIVVAADPWIHEGWTPSAYIDRSDNELDATVPVNGASDVWEVATAIAEAEFAALYFDSDGHPHYRTYRSDVSEEGQTVARTLTSTDALTQLDYVSGLTALRNYVSVPYEPTEFVVAGTIFQLGSVLRVPANGTVEVHFTPPGVPFGDAPVISDIDANTAADGSGSTVVPSSYGITTSQTFGIITITNDLPQDIWLVDSTGAATLTATGSYWRPSGSSPPPAVAVDAESQRRYRVQPLAVAASSWRQREESADAIARRLIGDLAFPRPVIRNVGVVGDPRLEIGDLVELVDRDGLGVDGAYRIAGIAPTTSAAGGFSQQLSVRDAQTVAEWDTALWDGSDVWGT